MSGSTAEDVGGELASAVSFIQKPFGAAELLARLAEIIAAGRQPLVYWTSPQIAS